MGGGYYDRDVISVPVNTTTSYGNSVVGKQEKLNAALDPRNYVNQGSRIQNDNLNPIIFALDVTGSMGQWPKIIYDKFPMFYGQIMMQNYLKDPAISFCAIGDAICDEAPLQVTEFGQGKQIDELIAKMWLEGGGGGNKHESYELAAHFYSKYVDLTQSQMSFFFVTGDQGYFDFPMVKHYQKVLGIQPPGEVVDGKAQWVELMKRYNVFHIKKQYDNKNHQKKIYQQWVETLGEQRVLKIQHPKACIDIILGAIAITSGVRDLETYVKDMAERGQDKQRIEQTIHSLEKYSQAIKTKKIVPIAKKEILTEAKDKFTGKIPASKYREDLLKMKEDFKGQIPENFLCGITNQIFVDPVMTADGQTYQRSAIQQWLVNHDTSPLTNERLPNKNLVPNILIKKLILEFHEKYLKK